MSTVRSMHICMWTYIARDKRTGRQRKKIYISQRECKRAWILKSCLFFLFIWKKMVLYRDIEITPLLFRRCFKIIVIGIARSAISVQENYQNLSCQNTASLNLEYFDSLRLSKRERQRLVFFPLSLSVCLVKTQTKITMSTPFLVQLRLLKCAV